MSPEARPAAAVYDPGSAEIPPTLGPVLTEPDTPILLLVAATADDRALQTAIGLAHARGAAGHATVLGDAAVTHPRLHELLGMENVEGLADLFLFGASLEHVRTRPPGWAFDFVPTGAYVPDPAAVLDSPRWDRIADELAEAGELLLLMVPAATPGLGPLSRRAGRAILVGDEAGVERAAARLDAGCKVVGVVTPAAGEAVAGGEGAGRAGPGAELTEPVVFRRETRRERLASPLLVIALIAAVAAGGWFLYREYLMAPASAPAAMAAEPTAAAPEPERGEAVETPLPISISVEAHQDLESARRRAEVLRETEPSIGFYLAPLSVNGALYYRLLAGPVESREAGDALMRRLVDAGHKTAYDSWAIRPSGLAFDLGEYDTRAEAGARVDSLRTLDIPAYVVTIRYDPGQPRYRVYGGGYENRPEAAVMERMLEEAGVEARLVQRTGEPVAAGA